METMVQSDPGTGLRKINEKLKNLFIPGVKLTPQEETVMNIIYKILEAPGTVKLTPWGKATYLINMDLHYYVRIGYGSIAIVNSTDSVVRHCPVSVSEFAQDIVNRSLDKDVDVVEKTLFHSEMSILKKIEEKLPENAETSS